MKTRALLACLLLVACAETGTGDIGLDAIQNPSGGDDADQTRNPGDSSDVDASFPWEEEPDADGGEPDGDGGVYGPIPDGAVPGDNVSEIGENLEKIAELTTCKPSEINPAMECVTVTCANLQGLDGPLCLLKNCFSLIEKVDPKCGECLFAAISQDVLGMLSCLDAGAILGEVL